MEDNNSVIDLVETEKGVYEPTNKVPYHKSKAKVQVQEEKDPVEEFLGGVIAGRKLVKQFVKAFGG